MGLDGTLYDQVLDWIFALGLAPARFSVRTHPVPLLWTLEDLTCTLLVP